MISQVGDLGDAMYLFARALNLTMASGKLNPGGREIARMAPGQFKGLTLSIGL